MNTTLKASLVGSLLLALTACGSNAPRTQGDLPPPPSQAEITQIATISYQNTHRGQSPRNLRINKVSADNFIGANQWDYYACLTISETQGATSYYSDGRVARAAGANYDVDYILHLRQYDYGWGSGILRTVNTASQIGRRSTRDLCPAQ